MKIKTFPRIGFDLLDNPSDHQTKLLVTSVMQAMLSLPHEGRIEFVGRGTAKKVEELEDIDFFGFGGGYIADSTDGHSSGLGNYFSLPGSSSVHIHGTQEYISQVIGKTRNLLESMPSRDRGYETVEFVNR